MKKYFKQNPRLNKRIRSVANSDVEEVFRPAQLHHDLRRSNVLDGVSSSTGVYDSEMGPVPDVFDIHVDRFDLADSLLRRGESLKSVNTVAVGQNTTTTE